MGRTRTSAARTPDDEHRPGRLRRYGGPWAVLGLLPWLALLARHLWGGEPMSAGFAAAAATAATIGLAAFTGHVFRARGESVRWQAVASVAAAGVWLTCAMVAGLRTRPIMDLWLGAGAVVCLAWNIRVAGRGQGDDAHRDDGGLMEKIGVAGRAGRAALEAGDTRVRVPVRLARGEATVDDLQAAKGRIASYVAVPRTRVRVEPHPDDHGRGDVVIVPRDLLAQPIVWPGPAAPGESIAEALPVGRYEDGEDARLWLPGDPKARRNSMHLAVMGMSGSGKSEGVLTLLAEVVTRPDAAVLYSDPVKGVQTVQALAPGIGLLLTDREQAVAAFKKLPTVIAQRTHWLGSHGFKQWTPGCGLKFLICVFEEAADFVSSSDTFVKVTEQARSAGISLVPSQQRMSHDRMQTSARYNLGGGWCFGTGDAISAEFALSSSTIDAGAAPETWKDTRPGYSYLEAAGVSESRWPVPLRTMLGEAAHHAEVVAEWSVDPGFDEVTAAAFGSVYADYRRQVADGATTWQTGPSRTVIPVAPVGQKPADPDDLDPDDDEVIDPDEVLDEDPPYEYDVPANPEPGFMADQPDTALASRPIADDTGIVAFTPPAGAGERLGTTAARRALRDELERLRSDGHEQVSTAQLVALRQRIGRSPSWLSGELARLVGEGALVSEPDRGVYAFADPIPVPA